MGPLSIEDVLADEAVKLAPPEWQDFARGLQDQAAKQESERRRARLDADERGGEDEDKTLADAERRKAFNRSLNKLSRSALCLSGGGIRSATFCLGVIQALAAHNVTVAHSSAAAAEQPRTRCWAGFSFSRPSRAAVTSDRGCRPGESARISTRFGAD